jgi:hypothetical protein
VVDDRIDRRGGADVIAGARVHGRLEQRQLIKRDDFFPGQVVGDTSAHARNIVRRRQIAIGSRGGGRMAERAVAAASQLLGKVAMRVALPATCTSTSQLSPGRPSGLLFWGAERMLAPRHSK